MLLPSDVCDRCKSIWSCSCRPDQCRHCCRNSANRIFSIRQYEPSQSLPWRQQFRHDAGLLGPAYNPVPQETVGYRPAADGARLPHSAESSSQTNAHPAFRMLPAGHPLAHAVDWPMIPKPYDCAVACIEPGVQAVEQASSGEVACFSVQTNWQAGDAFERIPDPATELIPWLHGTDVASPVERRSQSDNAVVAPEESHETGRSPDQQNYGSERLQTVHDAEWETVPAPAVRRCARLRIPLMNILRSDSPLQRASLSSAGSWQRSAPTQLRGPQHDSERRGRPVRPMSHKSTSPDVAVEPDASPPATSRCNADHECYWPER